MKRVLYIAYFFPPSAGAAVQRTARFVKYLREFGYEPIVVAPAMDAFRNDPLGFGEDRSFLPELPPDVKIYRIPPCQPFGLFRLLKKLKLLWLWSFFVRPDERLTWNLSLVANAVRIARREKVDIIYHNLGPCSSLFGGAVVRALTQRPWVLDFRDPWTQWPMGVWPTRLHFMVERWLEGLLLRRADGINIVSERWRKRLIADHPELDPARTTTITNGFDLATLPPLEELRSQRRDDGKLRIVHTGKFYDTYGSTNRSPLSAALKTMHAATLGWLQYKPLKVDNSTAGPTYLLRALKVLRDRDPESARMIEVEFIGRTHPRVREQIESLGLADIVKLTGFLPHDVCLRRMFAADALFLPFCRYEDGRPMDWLPLKLYEYMLSGKPVLAAAPESSIMEFLRQAGTGIQVSQDDPEAIAAALAGLLDRHRRGGIRMTQNWEFVRQFDRRELTRRLAEFMDRVLEMHARRYGSEVNA